MNARQPVFRTSAKLLKNPECKKYTQYSENFQGKLYLQGKPKLLKILKVKGIFNTVKNFRATLFFQGKHKLLKIVNGKKIFNAVCIHMGVICVIWASVVCNLDQSRD